MEQSLENFRKKAFTYAREAFQAHREQIFEAMHVINQCGDMARQSGLLALEGLAELWADEEGLTIEDSTFHGRYDEETLTYSLAGRDVPLKELLIFMVLKIVDASDRDTVGKEFLAQVEKNGCSGYEWLVAYLYLTGMLDIYAGQLPGNFYLYHRVMVPEEWLEDYDRYCQKMVLRWDERDKILRQEMVNESFEREFSVKRAFEKMFQEMESERLCYLLKELDYETLAAGTAFAGEAVRNRILEHMETRKIGLVIEEWSCKRNFGYHLSDILDATDRMLILAGLAGGMGFGWGSFPCSEDGAAAGNSP